jgi:hypothetical protein
MPLRIAPNRFRACRLVWWGDIVEKEGHRSSSIDFKKKELSPSYLDGLAVAGPGEDGDGEAVVASLHGEVVPPQLLLHVLRHPPAEDGDDADVESELEEKGRKAKGDHQVSWTRTTPGQPAQPYNGGRGMEAGTRFRRSRTPDRCLLVGAARAAPAGTHPLHGVEGARLAAFPPAQRGRHGGLDVGHQGAERVGAEPSLHDAAHAEVVVALVEEERLGPDHALLARRVRRPEEVRPGHEHHARRLRGRQDHARAAQHVRLEDLAVPAGMRGARQAEKLASSSHAFATHGISGNGGS